MDAAARAAEGENMMPSRRRLYQFAIWVASEICQEDFSKSADFFAEVACRKLAKLGIIKECDGFYSYESESEP